MEMKKFYLKFFFWGGERFMLGHLKTWQGNYSNRFVDSKLANLLRQQKNEKYTFYFCSYI